MSGMRFVYVNGGSILTSSSDEDIEKAKADVLNVLKEGKKMAWDLIDAVCNEDTEWSWKLSPHYTALSQLVESKDVVWIRDDEGYVWYFIPEEFVK